MKPDVVFFGENVLRPIVDAAYTLLFDARLLLIVGSSLAVFSGYRFARAAAERKIPIAVVNIGPTRADGLATLRLEGRIGAVLPELIGALGDLDLTEARIGKESKAS